MATSASMSPSEFVVPLLGDDVAKRIQQKELRRNGTSPLYERWSNANLAYIQERAARKTLGILLLSVVIVLWVSSSFLTYAIFSDDSYSKPYFVTYLNTSVFCFYLLPWGVRESLRWWRKETDKNSGEYHPIAQEGEEADDQDTTFGGEDRLGTIETMRLGVEFCLMWFAVSPPPPVTCPCAQPGKARGN